MSRVSEKRARISWYESPVFGSNPPVACARANALTSGEAARIRTSEAIASNGSCIRAAELFACTRICSSPSSTAVPRIERNTKNQTAISGIPATSKNAPISLVRTDNVQASHHTKTPQAVPAHPMIRSRQRRSPTASAALRSRSLNPARPDEFRCLATSSNRLLGLTLQVAPRHLSEVFHVRRNTFGGTRSEESA